MTSARADRLAVLALLAVPALVLGRALLPGRVLSPADLLVAAPLWGDAVAAANPLLADVAFMFHPWLVYAAEAIRSGRFPLWNPYAFTGVPFFANPQTALLFPLHGLAYVLPVPPALALIAILKLALAGLGTYWCVRQLAVAPGPSLVAALAFALNGVLIVWLQWSLGSAIAVLPWLIALTERLRACTDGRTVAGLALAVAILIFAGYPQAVALGVAASGAWLAARARGAAAPGRFVIGWLGGWSLGVALGAVQWVPFLEYLRESAVLAYRREWMWHPTLPPRAAVTLLMPHYYGSPAWGDFWGPVNFNEIAVTAGVVPLVSAPVALAAGWSRPGVRLCAGLALLVGGLLYTPAGAWLGALPALALVIPTRLAIFVPLALSVLTALGLQAAVDAPSRVRRVASLALRLTCTALALAAWLLVLDDAPGLAGRAVRFSPAAHALAFLALLTGAALVVLALLAQGPRARHWIALATLQVVSALPLAVTANPVIDAGRFYPPPPPTIQALRAELARTSGRVLVASGSVTNLGTIFRLPDVGGHDGMTPRRLEELADPHGSLDALASGPFHVSVAPGSTVARLLGIRAVLRAPDAPGVPATQAGPRVEWISDAQPRAFLVARARDCLSDAETLRLLHANAIDPRAEVVLAGCGLADDGAEASASPGSAEIVEDGAERVRVRTRAAVAAYLVLTDLWAPGWVARIDGEPRPLARANHAFRAVRVPPGEHTVEFLYEPDSLRWGLGLSLAALAVTVALGVGVRARRGA